MLLAACATLALRLCEVFPARTSKIHILHVLPASPFSTIVSCRVRCFITLPYGYFSDFPTKLSYLKTVQSLFLNRSTKENTSTNTPGTTDLYAFGQSSNRCIWTQVPFRISERKSCIYTQINKKKMRVQCYDEIDFRLFPTKLRSNCAQGSHINITNYNHNLATDTSMGA